MLVLGILSTAKGFSAPAVAKFGQIRILPSHCLSSLQMNKALQRPGQASSDAPSVALIGGGISGLTCARRLKELGLSPTV